VKSILEELELSDEKFYAEKVIAYAVIDAQWGDKRTLHLEDITDETDSIINLDPKDKVVGIIPTADTYIIYGILPHNGYGYLTEYKKHMSKPDFDKLWNDASIAHIATIEALRSKNPSTA
jgi:hypothetical protein